MRERDNRERERARISLQGNEQRTRGSRERTMYRN